MKTKKIIITILSIAIIIALIFGIATIIQNRKLNAMRSKIDENIAGAKSFQEAMDEATNSKLCHTWYIDYEGNGETSNDTITFNENGTYNINFNDGTSSLGIFEFNNEDEYLKLTENNVTDTFDIDFVVLDDGTISSVILFHQDTNDIILLQLNK